MQVKADAPYNIWIRDYVEKYYEKVDGFFYWNRTMAKEQVDYVFYKHLYKLKKEYEYRMIRSGYQNPEKKSFGKYFDIERAFQGYPGPITTNVNNHLFKESAVN